MILDVLFFDDEAFGGVPCLSIALLTYSSLTLFLPTDSLQSGSVYNYNHVICHAIRSFVWRLCRAGDVTVLCTALENEIYFEISIFNLWAPKFFFLFLLLASRIRIYSTSTLVN